MSNPIRPLEIKMQENGDMLVRWSNTPKIWNIIKACDREIQCYVIFKMSRHAA
jgi:hypothetical protein